MSTNCKQPTKSIPLEHLLCQLTQNGQRPVLLYPRTLKMLEIIIANQDRIARDYDGSVELHFKANDVRGKIPDPLKRRFTNM